MSVITTTLLKMHDPIRWSVFDECTFSLFHTYRWGDGGPRRLMSSLGFYTADDKPRLRIFCLCAPCGSVLRLPSTKRTGRKAAGRQWQMAARWPQGWLWEPEGKQSSLLWLCPCLYFACWAFLGSVFWGGMLGTELKVLGTLDKCSATELYLSYSFNFETRSLKASQAALELTPHPRLALNLSFSSLSLLRFLFLPSVSPHGERRSCATVWESTMGHL